MPNTTAGRVPEHTHPDVNQQIREQTEARVARLAGQGALAIDQRLDELEREWDIERTLEANAASLSLLSLFLGVTVSPWWLVLTTVIAGFLLQHATQGWCPPLPLFRKQGVRTLREIDEERYALKFLRGDFDGLLQAMRDGEALQVGQVMGAVTRP